METKGNNTNIELLRGKVEKIRTAMLTTFSDVEGFHSRPMGTAEVDEEGHIWFFTNEFSAKAEEISSDNRVSLTYADTSNNTYLSITGKAYLVDDRAKMEKLWNPFVKAFFPEGIDDPKLTLLKIAAAEMEYWDSSSSKIVVLFNILKANILGKQFDEGEHGKVSL